MADCTRLYEMEMIFSASVGYKEIMSVGTEDYDDYYPYCHLEYHPENMYCNRGGE